MEFKKIYDFAGLDEKSSSKELIKALNKKIETFEIKTEEDKIFLKDIDDFVNFVSKTELNNKNSRKNLQEKKSKK